MPVHMREAPLARNSTASAMSSGSTMRPSGIFFARFARCSADGACPPPKPVAVGPGQTALTRILSGASS
jgi:hypothetical protein